MFHIGTVSYFEIKYALLYRPLVKLELGLLEYVSQRPNLCLISYEGADENTHDLRLSHEPAAFPCVL